MDLANIKDRAITESVLRREDPYYDPEHGEASQWDKVVTPDVVLGLVYELERLRGPSTGHQFAGTVKRADGIIVTATLTVPDGHPAVSPEPLRPWHGTDRTNQNFLELGELAMMIAQRGYGIVEGNERSRERWGKQDYWADLLDIAPPTPAIEA